MEKIVYLDNAAAAVPDAGAVRVLAEESLRHYANAEAVHLLSYRAREALKSAGRRLSQAFFGRDDYPVIWGSSATELFRIFASCGGFRRTFYSALEHPALAVNLKKFSENTQLPVDRSGRIGSPDTEIIPDAFCFHQVQSELGVMQDCAALAEFFPSSCRLTDAVQAAGKFPLVRSGDCWVISGVKFGSPGGAAILLDPDSKYCEKLLEAAEVVRHRDYAVSRISVPVMLAMASAAETAAEHREENLQKISRLNSFIREGVKELGIESTLPSSAVVSPYILNLMLPEQESAVVVRALGERGVYAASGSACSAESGEPSPALQALGIRGRKLYRALRVSFGSANREEDGEIFLSELKKVLKNY